MSKTVEANLNGLQLSIDAKTGGIVKMSYPGPETMIDASPGETGMIDLAYPIKQFEPLRLASRFSSDAKIDVTDDSLTVSWSKLGASRTNFPLDGDVSATVRFKAEPDGKSIIMTCEVDNKSKTSVRQVIFPDFYGLVPFNDEDNTIFKTCGFGSTPFRELHNTEGRKSTQFCMDVAALSAEYASGGKFSGMWNRWMDFGGLKGGFSVFPRSWGWDPRYTVRLNHSETEEKLRMLCVHPVEVKPGEKWQSPEFVFTPHQSGWAKGIEPYREWVKQHMNRLYPLPKQVKEGLGYRTIWMSLGWPDDPKDAVWKVKDIVELSKENIEHGLTEMSIWGWHRGFRLPVDPVLPNLGTQEEFAKAIIDSRKLGVNVAPFISVVLAGPETAHKYGLQVSQDMGWTQHTDTIPRFNPPYSSMYAAAHVPLTNELWQKEVLESIQSFLDSGITSIGWDQFWNREKDYNMIELTKKIRAMTKAKDPDASFYGEELWNMELDAELLDYTWNWGGYGDCQAFTNSFSAPRMNACISDDTWSVKRAFIDNLYMNIFPRKPGSVNGSDWIKNWPELSKALKQCANLRKQFLPYFTEGVLIGNNLLTEPCGAVHTSYVMPDKIMSLVMNESGNERAVTFKFNLLPWMKSPSNKYEMRVYDIDGNLLETKEISSRVKTMTTKKLGYQDITVYEFIAK
ncbi:MAG: hypothetical protein ACYC27_18945 [Armatimonadota bacterium]